MKQENLAASIRSKFAEHLEHKNATTDSIIKVVAMEFRVEQSVVIDAITKGCERKRGVRK